MTEQRVELLQTISVQCPYCGETIQILVDRSIGEQEYVEDCQVCCQPILLNVSPSHSGEIRIRAGRENP